jgi:hypothetical protein
MVLALMTASRLCSMRIPGCMSIRFLMGRFCRRLAGLRTTAVFSRTREVAM